MLSAQGAHLRSHAFLLTLVVQICLYMKHVIARQAGFALMQPSGTWYYITLQSFQVSLRHQNASHTGKVAEIGCERRHETEDERLVRSASALTRIFRRTCLTRGLPEATNATKASFGRRKKALGSLRHRPSRPAWHSTRLLPGKRPEARYPGCAKMLGNL